MRFKNLTITLTLTCLSIVAIAGLLLLPIIDGICEWTGNESSKSYYKELLDDEEQGWKLSASLVASRNIASSSVTPSIHTVEVFTSEVTYSGSANMRAWRNTGHRWGIVHCSYNNGCENYHNCPGHQQMVREEGDEDIDARVIYATVDEVTEYKVWGYEKHWITGRATGLTAEINIGKEDYAKATLTGNEYNWTESGVRYWERIKKEVTNPYPGPSQGASAEVKNYSSTDCGAKASFNFEHPIKGQIDIRTINSVSYTGVIQPRRP